MLTKETIIEAHRYAPKLWLIVPANAVGTIQSDINAVLVEVSEVLCDALIGDIEYMRRIYEGGLIEWGSTRLDMISLRAWFLPAEWLDRMMIFAERDHPGWTWGGFFLGEHPTYTRHPHVNLLTMESLHTVSRHIAPSDTPIVFRLGNLSPNDPIFPPNILEHIYCIVDGGECIEIKDETLNISQNAAWFTARNAWNGAHLCSFSVWMPTWEEIRKVFTRVKREV